ncbi:MAG TPA: hypothetical protein VEV84_10465 [Pyrinomonadaceae bacterium]|jgi:hypothetical protein|nr:hypothetical protein [Pyrinomonadaceae bacterium]
MLQTQRIILFVVFLGFTGSVAYSQSSTFSDPNVEYTFMLPESGWKLISKPSATSPNVEYVYSDRREALLTVRKLSVAKDASFSDVIRDEEQKVQFFPGYVAGKEENFSGNLRGSVFNFEYVSSGRNNSGRYYFLRANDTTVYVLRFTGNRDRLKSIRNQTDSIARTFAVKT